MYGEGGAPWALHGWCLPRSGGGGVDRMVSRISKDIEWFQLKPFDLGGPTSDTRDRMVSIETIRSQGSGPRVPPPPEIEWFQMKPFDLQ